MRALAASRGTNPARYAPFPPHIETDLPCGPFGNVRSPAVVFADDPAPAAPACSSTNTIASRTSPWIAAMFSAISCFKPAKRSSSHAYGPVAHDHHARFIRYLVCQDPSRSFRATELRRLLRGRGAIAWRSSPVPTGPAYQTESA